MKLQKILISSGILFCLLYIILVLYGFYKEPRDGLERIKYETGLEFPTNSIVVYFVWTKHTIDPAWASKIAIPKASSDELIQSIKAKCLLDMTCTTVDGSVPSDSVDWWNPKNVIFDCYYDGGENDRFLVHVIFTNEEDDYVTLYVECMM